MAAAKMNRSADLVVLPAEGRGMQPRHYDSARPLLASRGADLVLVVDLDEFMYSSTPLPLASELRRAFADPSVGQVSCKWRMFGSSGLPSQPASVRESFVRRAAREHAGDKSAARLPHLARFGVHRHLLRRGVPAGCPEGVRLNHYRAQSEEFWRVKMGRAPRGWKARDAARARREADRNEVEDAELREMVVGGRLRGSRIGIGGFGSGSGTDRSIQSARM
ncbi:hypothetical protein DFJ74DRAFT_652592 [Hyaloraphidium curvatum]|nr:hypothetical protein DFJ74DRAFT_652592 [Hyaloraphidium curvatum]